MIHILTGKEKYLSDHEAEKLAGNGMKFSDFNREVYENIDVLPIFEDAQKILVTPEKLPTDEKFMSLLKEGTPSFTTLVIVPAKLDKRTKAYALAKKKGYIKEFDKVSREKLEALLCRLIQKNNGKIRKEQMNHLIDRSGYLVDEEVDLYQMKIWCKQICFAAEVVTNESIDTFVPESDQTSVFAMSGYILSGNGKAAMKLAGRLIEEKESPIRLLSLLLRSFRLGYKRQMYPELNDKEAAKKIGVTTYQLLAVKEISPEKIGACMDIVEKAIAGIKTGNPASLVFLTALSDMIEEVAA